LVVEAAPTRSFHRPRHLDVIPSLTWTSFRGREGLIGGTPGTGGIGTGFEDEGGFGLAVNAFLTRKVSGEFGGSYVSPATEFSPTRGALGQLVGSQMRIIPLTAALQYHFLPDRSVDPYIGVGGAYVMMDAVDAFGGSAGIQNIEFDDKAGLLFNAGVSFGLGGNVAINLDAKYLPITSEGAPRSPTAVSEDRVSSI
jgi:outer membrane protein